MTAGLYYDPPSRARLAALALAACLVIGATVAALWRAAATPHAEAAARRAAVGSAPLALATAGAERAADVAEAEREAAERAAYAAMRAAWPSWMPAAVTRWAPLAEEAGERHGVDPVLIGIVILVESGGDPQALSPAGASGLMQVMLTTANGFARQRGLEGVTAAQLSMPEVNLDFGAMMLVACLQLVRMVEPGVEAGRAVDLAARCYNGGPGGLSAPAAESVALGRWVSGMWSERHDDESQTFAAWLAAGGRVAR
ncbi:transglycosylase SLT domain-containing protein [uncultured Piscinibacter sp.]|uniref:transglycosylase SLT domain-containing protein n=1 Tax=uncultured Piscinibacter sp. TaxID=1131835 RepID=UPI0026267463|nr:transglycosylase SLT domain-containing protein [uncultured Piscinibacter sp.]